MSNTDGPNGDDRRNQDNVIHLESLRRLVPPVRTGDGPGAPLGEGLSFEEPGAPDPAVMAAAVEAVLFTAGRPLPFADLREILGTPDSDELRASLAQLQTRYERGGHGLRLVEVAGGWQIRTHPRYATWALRARGVKPLRLSRAAIETLSIIAYRQPVTRADVEDIRGVDSGGIIRTLLEKELVRTMGHRNEPGRPLTYGTTDRFLEIFGLRDLSDLPALRDLRALTDDDSRDSVGLGDSDVGADREIPAEEVEAMLAAAIDDEDDQNAPFPLFPED